MRVTFRIRAAGAQKVQILFSNPLDPQTPFDMTKDDGGNWNAYASAIGWAVAGRISLGLTRWSSMGATMPDPASQSFFGNGILKSGVEVPAAGVDFFDTKPVPHGDLRNKFYVTKAGAERHAYIHTRRRGMTKDVNDALTRCCICNMESGATRRSGRCRGGRDLFLDNLIAAGEGQADDRGDGKWGHQQQRGRRRRRGGEGGGGGARCGTGSGRWAQGGGARLWRRHRGGGRGRWGRWWMRRECHLWRHARRLGAAGRGGKRTRRRHAAAGAGLAVEEPRREEAGSS